MCTYGSTMQGYLDTVVSNRMELAPKQEEPDKDTAKDASKTSKDSAKETDKDTVSPEGSKEGTEEKPTEVDVPEKFFNKE